MSAHLGKQFPDRNAVDRTNGQFPAGTFFAYNRRAHSLVELAIAVAVVAVLAGIGWGVFQDRFTTYRMLDVARMLQSDLATLRSLAIDTNREARVHFVEADTAMDPDDAQHGAWELQMGNRSSGSTEWDTLPIDVGGVVDSSEGERSLEPDGRNEARFVSLATWGTLEDDAIRFTPRGWLGNGAGDYVDGEIVLKVVNKRALGKGATEEVTLRVARSGLVRMESSPR